MSEFYPRVVSLAAKRLRDADGDVREAAAVTVGDIARSVPLVTTAMKTATTPSRVAERAAAVLLTPLFAMLAEKNATAQDGAARALKRVFHEAGVVLYPPAYAPGDSGPDEADEPDGLGVVRGSVMSRTITRLLSALRSSDVEAKAAVAEALGALVEAVPEGAAPRAEQIVLAAEEMLLSQDWGCRKAGAEVLHVCALWLPVCAGEFAPEIITLLAPLKHDKMKPVRDAAVAALETFATQDVVAYSAPATSPVARALSARQRHRVAVARERGKRSASGADRADDARQRIMDARHRQFLKKRSEDDGIIMVPGWERGGGRVEEEEEGEAEGEEGEGEREDVKGGKDVTGALLVEMRSLIGELRGELRSAHSKIARLERGQLDAPAPQAKVKPPTEASRPSRAASARQRRPSLTIEFVGVKLEPEPTAESQQPEPPPPPPPPPPQQQQQQKQSPQQRSPAKPAQPPIVVVVPPLTPWERISSLLAKGDTEGSFLCALEDGGTDETLIRLIGRTASSATPLFVTLSAATASRLLLRVAALLRGKHFLHHLLPLVRQAAVHMPKVPLAVLREVAGAVEESVSDVTRLPGLAGEALAKTANQIHSDLLRAILNAYNTELARERERATRVQVV